MRITVTTELDLITQMGDYVKKTNCRIEVNDDSNARLFGFSSSDGEMYWVIRLTDVKDRKFDNYFRIGSESLFHSVNGRKKIATAFSHHHLWRLGDFEKCDLCKIEEVMTS